MYVALSRSETHQNFNIWVYGEREKLLHGSGLFVGETGVSANHHLLTPHDGKAFCFIEGHYKLDVIVHLLADRKPMRLFSLNLEISRDTAADLAEKTAGLYFDWGPDSSRYLSHVEKRPFSSNVDDFLQLFGKTSRD